MDEQSDGVTVKQELEPMTIKLYGNWTERETDVKKSPHGDLAVRFLTGDLPVTDLTEKAAEIVRELFATQDRCRESFEVTIRQISKEAGELSRRYREATELQLPDSAEHEFAMARAVGFWEAYKYFNQRVADIQNDGWLAAEGNT